MAGSEVVRCSGAAVARGLPPAGGVEGACAFDAAARVLAAPADAPHMRDSSPGAHLRRDSTLSPQGLRPEGWDPGKQTARAKRVLRKTWNQCDSAVGRSLVTSRAVCGAGMGAAAAHPGAPAAVRTDSGRARVAPAALRGRLSPMLGTHCVR